MREFRVDLSAHPRPFPHYWEECVGSGHATLALREDWRRQLKKCRDELGFKRVRFHGLLNDDMGVWTGDEACPYSFFNVDAIFDFLLEIGMKPFVELSFMPEGLASGKETIFHYRANVTPPRDYEAWRRLIGELARHLLERYGLDEVRRWPFEVWNEPNLPCFWTGGREEYFRLYRTTAEALKEVEAGIPVGGPATAKNKWIPEFIAYREETGTPLDFISTHHYPTDVALGHGLDMEAAMAASKRGILTEMATKARREAGKYPLYYTEWSSSPSSRDPYHDDPYAAAFIIKTVADNQGLVDLYSYWTFSDIFEEVYFPSLPFHGGFGLLNLHGIPKPAYHAFRLLHLLGEERLSVTAEGGEETVECLATTGRRGLAVVVYNHQIPRAPIRGETVRLRVRHQLRGTHVQLVRIDEEHGNPKRLWQELGSPVYLKPDMVERLCLESAPRPEHIPWEWEEGEARLAFTVPPHGVVGIFDPEAWIGG
ncbi:MAG: GH39 family glycosyl hydrolase [Bacillota bacterium]